MPCPDTSAIDELLDAVHKAAPGMTVGVWRVLDGLDAAVMHGWALDAIRRMPAPATFSFVTAWNLRSWLVVADPDRDLVEAVDRVLKKRMARAP